MTARLKPRRSIRALIHKLVLSILLVQFAMTARAPCINEVRICFSPRLLILPNVGLPPVEYYLGTKPIQAANWRLVAKCLASLTVATTAVAVTSPIPGMVINRFASFIWLARA